MFSQCSQKYLNFHDRHSMGIIITPLNVDDLIELDKKKEKKNKKE